MDPAVVHARELRAFDFHKMKLRLEDQVDTVAPPIISSTKKQKGPEDKVAMKEVPEISITLAKTTEVSHIVEEVESKEQEGAHVVKGPASNSDIDLSQAYTNLPTQKSMPPKKVTPRV